MKAVPLKKLKDELHHQTKDELEALCLHLMKFKKENKELLTYLLFESHDEENYVKNVKNFLNPLFEEINIKSFFYIRKSMRKILTLTKKYIRYSKQKETEIELLLFYCKKLQNFSPDIQQSPRLKNVFNRQLIFIQKAIETLHEDLQFEYQPQLDALLKQK